jgi:hypothetical protein
MKPQKANPSNKKAANNQQNGESIFNLANRRSDSANSLNNVGIKGVTRQDSHH